jgi:hypothetical protein
MAQMQNQDHETLVQARAFQLWREDGCPAGGADDLLANDLLERARELVAIEENQMLATKPNPQRRDIRRDLTTGEPVEPLTSVANQGEFPTLTDQGEEQTYPIPPAPPHRPH